MANESATHDGNDPSVLDRGLTDDGITDLESAAQEAGVQDVNDQEAAAYEFEGNHTSLEAVLNNTSPTPPRVGLSTEGGETVPRNEFWLGVTCVVAWACFFSCGLFVSTQEARLKLWSGNAGVTETVGFMLITICCYTLTNIAILSCTSAILGGMTRRWHVGEPRSRKRTTKVIPPSRCYLSAFLRGFFLYLFFLAGFLAVATQATVVETTVDQYVRIAGIVSVLAFIVGYDPAILNRLIGKVIDITDLNDTHQPNQASIQPPASSNGGSSPTSGQG